MNKPKKIFQIFLAVTVITIFVSTGCTSMMTAMMSDKMVANAVTEPSYEKSPVFGNPAEHGMGYEDVSFKTSDGVTLSGWLIKGGENKIVIISHFGIASSRSGYTPEGKGMFKPYPKKIEYLKIARHLVDNGYNVLMYDLRNHGKSEKGTNQWITLGVEEYRDVLAAVDFVSSHEVYKESQIGLLSLCMGSVSSIYAYGIEGGLQENENIKAFIAVQPQGGVTFLRSFGFSEKKIKDANKLNMERGGRDLYRSFVPHLKDVSVPTMIVQGKNDPWTDIDEVKSYYDALEVDKEMVWIEDADERFDAYDYFGHSPEKMLSFFSKHLRDDVEGK